MKTYFITTILLLFIIPAKAQLPIVYSSEGTKSIDWSKEKRKIELGDETPFLYGSGCTESPQRASASSALASQGNANYKAENLFDWDPQTAWIEGKSDYGIGEHFKVDLPYGGNHVGIFNGYQKSYETWRNNSRVKKFKVYGDGVPLCYLVLQDLMGSQTFDIPEKSEHDIYTFQIIEVYPGEKWKDVAISEICNMGCCFNINTQVQAHGKQISADNLKKGVSILSVDMTSEKTQEKEISNVIQMKHSKLIRVTTINHTIEITAYHPIYIKDIGFTSLLKIKKQLNLDTYDQLCGNLWALVWNEKDKTMSYERIDNIDLLSGEYNTYSILDIKLANTYILNGFVSTTYSK